MSGQLELLEWSGPSCRIICFPLPARVGRVRDVAAKMIKQPPARVEFYRVQVSEGLLAHLQRLGISEREQSEMVRDFWAAVDRELSRRGYHRDQQPGGAA